MTDKTITLYSLTTCVFCQAIKKMLDDLDISFRCIQADELPEKDRRRVGRELREVNPQCSFPTVVVGDEEKTFELLRSLLTNKKRYGYMACPCRLASGKRDSDHDIICLCDYRKPDVTEYGSCFCSLYVSADWYTGKIEREEVPERRPPELFDF